jgi:hypothetical protein
MVALFRQYSTDFIRPKRDEQGMCDFHSSGKVNRGQISESENMYVFGKIYFC